MKKFFITLCIVFSFFFIFSIKNVNAFYTEQTNYNKIIDDNFINTIRNNNSDFISYFNSIEKDFGYGYMLVGDKTNNVYLFKYLKNTQFDGNKRINNISLNKYDNTIYYGQASGAAVYYIADITSKPSNITFTARTGQTDYGSIDLNNLILISNNDIYFSQYPLVRNINGNSLVRTLRYNINNDYYIWKTDSILFSFDNNFNINYNFDEKAGYSYVDKYQYDNANNINQDVLNYINNRNNIINNFDNFSIYLRGGGLQLLNFDSTLASIKYKYENNLNKFYTYDNNNNQNLDLSYMYFYNLFYDNNNNCYIWSRDTSYYQYDNYGFTRVLLSNFNIYDENNNLYFEKNFSNTPTMSLKGMYNSNDNDLFEVGKVTVYFQESDDSIDNFKYVNFRLQTISNDMTEENIPIFSHYKIYGKIDNQSDSSSYEEIDLTDFNYEDEDENGNIITKGMNFKIINKEYDYNPNRLAMSMLEFQLDYLESVNTIYEYWKIEFYFDNATNGTINVYDSLDNSLWDCSAKFLDEYDFYYFPSNYKYAYISSENYQNTGRIYFPTNSILNPQILLQAQYFNINFGTYESPIETHTYNDTFYSYIDFDFNNSKQLLVLNRTYGTIQNNQGLLYGSNFLEFIYNNCFNINKKIDKLMEYNKELTYFYVPKGYTVVFSDGTGTYQINTGNGFITINEDNNTNIYEANEKNKSVSLGSVIQEIIDMFGNATKPLEKTKEIYDKFRNYNIGNYIFLVITTSIIILVIKSFRR